MLVLTRNLSPILRKEAMHKTKLVSAVQCDIIPGPFMLGGELIQEWYYPCDQWTHARSFSETLVETRPMTFERPKHVERISERRSLTYSSMSLAATAHRVTDKKYLLQLNFIIP